LAKALKGAGSSEPGRDEFKAARAGKGFRHPTRAETVQRDGSRRGLGRSAASSGERHIEPGHHPGWRESPRVGANAPPASRMQGCSRARLTTPKSRPEPPIAGTRAERVWEQTPLPLGGQIASVARCLNCGAPISFRRSGVCKIRSRKRSPKRSNHLLDATDIDQIAAEFPGILISTSGWPQHRACLRDGPASRPSSGIEGFLLMPPHS